MKSLVILVSGAFLTILPISADARTWIIREDGSGDMPTIQGGIVRAVTGDTVLVMPGTYHEDIDFLGKGVVLKSDSGPAATILNGANEDSSIVIFKRGESSQAVLDGFTLTEGIGTPIGGGRYGGAVFSNKGASPVIQNNLFTRNSAEWGGAIHLGELSNPVSIGSPLVRTNTLVSNTARASGGAIRVYSSNATIDRNIFTDNVCEDGDGGALSTHINIGRLFVTSNEFIRNWASDHGGGISTYASRVQGAGAQTITDNLFFDNTANGLGLADTGAGGGLIAWEIWGSVVHNTFVRNSGLGASSNGGGGMALLNTRSDLDVSRNLVAFNEGCAISCFSSMEGTLGANLLWGNSPTDVGRACPYGDPPVIEDPWFCKLEGGDYRVAANSPALGDGFYFGAYPTPGCNAVPVTSLTTWSSIKTRYWRDGTVIK